jgi:hypothetical protein
MYSQRLASRRLTPIKTAKEATNLMAADLNLGADVGAKTGVATSVRDMRNTFNQFGWFSKIGKRGDQSCRSAAAHLSDLRADVCSRQDTPLNLLRLIVGRPVPVEAVWPQTRAGLFKRHRHLNSVKAIFRRSQLFPGGSKLLKMRGTLRT